MSRLTQIMKFYGCSSESARRYIDLREEGHGTEAAALMAGLGGLGRLTDPPDPDPHLEDSPQVAALRASHQRLVNALEVIAGINDRNLIRRVAHAALSAAKEL